MHAFDVLGDPVRRRILELLLEERSAGEVTAVIAVEFGITQPAVSQHLRVLRENGFARVRAEGTRRWYVVEADQLRDVDRWLQPFRAFWDHRLDALGTELARGRRQRRTRTSTTTKEPHVFDMIEELAAIHRRVERDDAAGNVSVAVTRTYHADSGDVWEALTDPDRLPRWFYPVSGDLQVGGSFQFEGSAGGEIRRCDRPTHLQVTFGGPDSIVDVRLTGAGDRTTVELVHTVPLAMAGSGAGALFVGPGWDGALLGLGLHLRGEAVGDPVAAANSPAVIEFNRGSISRWAEVVTSSGSATAEEIDGAREMAIAQYTTPPS